MQYFSHEWFEELARRLNADPEWGKKAVSLTTRITLTVTDRGLCHQIEVAGGRVSTREAKPDEVADFKFEAPWEIWGKVAAGSTDFNTAVITGKMKFKGSLPKIMGIQTQMNHLTKAAKDIPATM